MRYPTCYNAKQAHALRSVCAFACAGALGLIIGNGIASVSTSVPVAYAAVSTNQQGGGSSTDPNSHVIEFKDENLKKALLDYMKKKGFIGSDATDITEAQAKKVEDLSNYVDFYYNDDDYEFVLDGDIKEDPPLMYKKIQHLDGLEKFTQLKKLDLSGNNISDLTPLKGLTSLEILTLDENKISDIQSLSSLTNLKALRLCSASIRDWSPLNKLQLRSLYLESCNIKDLKPLESLFEHLNNNLVRLSLSDNLITDIAPLRKLTNLKNIDLCDNQITDISPLQALSNPATVDLSSNQITDFSSINSNIGGTLTLDDNPITSLDPISKLTNRPSVSLEGMEITRKVSASTIDLSTLWPYAQYCTFSFNEIRPYDYDKLPQLTSSVGSIQGKTFTLKSLPADKKKVTLHFMVKDSLPSLLSSLGVKDAENYNGVYYSGKLVLDYSSEEEPQVGPLYRLYNPYTHEHFFTAETTENDNLVRLGWKSEGGVGYIYKHGEKGGVYRLYNPTTGEHHYTMKEDEVAKCVKDGWKNEGVKWFSAQNKEVTLNKLYSMYNPYEKKFYHHYTADAKEIEQMVKAGWRKEEVKWCTLPVSAVK